MTRSTGTLIKFTALGVVMAMLTAFLFLVFNETRTGDTEEYSAVFADASRLEAGDTVRIAGIRVGTVGNVSLLPDRKVLVRFDTDRNIKLTTGTKAAIRYLNLVGDRYMELVDTPGSTKILPAGVQIPVERTAPALDLDLLLGGLKPVIQGLNPQDVNALTGSLVQLLQGQGVTLDLKGNILHEPYDTVFGCNVVGIVASGVKTVYRRRAQVSACARPCPRAPPVINAVFPSRSPISVLLVSRLDIGSRFVNLQICKAQIAGHANW